MIYILHPVMKKLFNKVKFVFLSLSFVLLFKFRCNGKHYIVQTRDGDHSADEESNGKKKQTYDDYMRPMSAIPKTAVNISNNWQVSTETTSEEEINLMDSINQEMSDMRTENVPKKFTEIFEHERYLEAEEMVAWLQNLAKISEKMKLVTIGKTYEERDIHIVKVNSDNVNLPVIFIDAGIHSQEWIAPAATLYLIERLVKASEKGDQSVKSFQWHIIPLANPDGYAFTRISSENRYWRKNRVINPGSECKGVNLNRNFDVGYGIGAASDDPCDISNYKGREPFSENETRAIKGHIQNTSNIQAAISVHAYGNVLLYPWGYKKTAHPRRSELRRVAENVVRVINETTGENYTVGSVAEVWGADELAGGCSDDWYIAQNISYSYTIELPQNTPTNRTDWDWKEGFLMPPSNIKKVGKQLFEGFLTLARELRKNMKK